MSEVVDANGYELMVGQRVQVGDVAGEVVSVSDADGDIDEGRMVGIDPVVEVEYADGTSEEFGAPWSAAGPWDEDAPFRCDDVTVLP